MCNPPVFDYEFTPFFHGLHTLSDSLGKAFETTDGNHVSYDADYFAAWVANNLGDSNPYPNSEIMCDWESGIWEYNCHVFAWNNWQAADRWSSESDMWKLGKPSPYNLMWRSYPDVWYTDTDNPIGIVSYISASSSEAAICTYSGNHSARIVGDGSYFISKWGSLPIIKHPPTEVPLSYGAISAYYKINPAYRPIGDGDPAGRDWETISNAISGITSGSLISVLSGTQTLTGNISVPSGVTLEIQSGVTVNLGSYSIISSGGTITVASDATLSPDARRVSGSTLLGLYPSITSALSAASSGQTVEYGGSHTMSGILTVASGITLSAKAGSTLSFGSGYYLYINGTLNASGTSSTSTTFTRNGSSGTWGGILYQSGSSG